MIDPVIDPKNKPKIDQVDPKINQNNQKIDQSNPFFLSWGSLLYYDDRSWIDPLSLLTFLLIADCNSLLLKSFLSAASIQFNFS